MSSFYLQQFEEKFKEFIVQLSTKFGNKIEIEVYKRSLDKLDYTKIASHLANELEPYSKLVSACDEGLFNIDNLQFIDQINFNELWTADLGKKDRESMWQYIQILFLLSNLIIDNKNKTSTTNDKVCEVVDNKDESSSRVEEINEADEKNSENPNNIGSEETINQMIEAMKVNMKNSDVEQLDINNISKEQVEDATNEVKNRFQSGSNNIMEDMIGEINKELNTMIDNKDKKDLVEEYEPNPQLDMMSQMLNIDKNGLGGIMNIANKVSKKFQSKVETGELNPNDLMQSAQSMLLGMQNMK